MEKIGRREVPAQLHEAEENKIEVQSLCMSCHKEGGTTQLLCAQFPHFSDVLIMSFECPHCGWRNREVQSAETLAPRGRRFTLRVTEKADLDRQVKKSDYASFHIPSIDFEIPSATQRGVVTTVEGILREAANALEMDQSMRRLADRGMAEKLQTVIDKIKNFASGNEFPFNVVLDDPSGNSSIEQLKRANSAKTLNRDNGVTSLRSNDLYDDNVEVVEYERTTEQLNSMGHFAPEAASDGVDVGKSSSVLDNNPEAAYSKSGADLPPRLKPPECTTASDALEKIHLENCGGEDGPMTFETPCSNCSKLGSTHIVEIDIPGFRKCLLMAFTCEMCGAKSSEVKPAGPYGEKGRQWRLTVESLADLNRDILKSDTARLEIPELRFEAEAGTLGGMFTTIEGVLTEMADSFEKRNPFVIGDSASDDTQRQKLQGLVVHLRGFANGEPSMLPFTLVIDDAADNSYIGNRHPTFDVDATMARARTPTTGALVSTACANDSQLCQTLYERSFEQNEELGINDMQTENY